MNALRALVTAAVPARILGPSGKLRQQRNALLLLGATLHEALDVLEDLGPVFGTLPSVQKHLVPLAQAPDWQDLKKNVLKPVRNAVAFHFQANTLPQQFVREGTGDITFQITDSEPSSDPYYQLADDSLTESAFAAGKYAEPRLNHLRFLNDAIVYAGYYCRAVDAVLLDVAGILGFLPTDKSNID